MAKKCNKEGCNNGVFGGGYCQNHKYLRIKKEVKEVKDRGLFVREKPKIVFEEFYKKALNMWFNQRRKEMPDKCQNNCGANTLKYNEKMWKYSVAHIIPKSPKEGCPSVSCDENNVVYLCWQCHNDYDSTWEKAKTMKIWDLTKRKAKTFIHRIPQNEYKKFLDNFK